jgi:hypothetical protein
MLCGLTVARRAGMESCEDNPPNNGREEDA